VSAELVLPDWLADPGLRRVWSAVRARLERSGLEPTGRVYVRDLTRAERHAVSGLFGVPVIADDVRLDLPQLDAALRSRAGSDLVTVVTLATGTPVSNRQAERIADSSAREMVFSGARRWLGARPDVAALPWVEDWLAAVRRSGLLARLPERRRLPVLIQALTVLAELTSGSPAGLRSRSEVAAAHTGDAHGLDDGTPVGQLVLRGLALVAGTDPPGSAAGRRALWEEFGVAVDRVSVTCLTLGLRPVAAGPAERRLHLAADAGDPAHITAWDIARLDLSVAPGTKVLVCENPRVLEAVAERFRGNVPVVCGSGTPAVVVLEVLRALARSDADLRYHGDFDWPGIAIANRLVADVGVRPWLMSALAYEAAARPHGLPLCGAPVEAGWDAELAPAMRARGVAVHEEAVIETLLHAVANSCSELR